MMSSTNVILLLGLLIQRASAVCSRSVLQDSTTAYLSAVVAGQSSLLPLAPGGGTFSYAENDVTTDITKGVLSSPIKVDFNLSFHDTTECATFTEISAATSEHPYVIHTRMLLDSSTSKIKAIESVVTDAGDWAFNATGHLFWARQEKWDAIPTEKRDARATIQAAADAYLDQWGNASLPVPHGTPCARLEGGAYTGSRNPDTNTCAMPAFPQPLKVGHRRYVIDEEFGVVDVFNDFPWLDATRPEGTPSSNLVRVEGGKIRYIHEMTVCATPRCGR